MTLGASSAPSPHVAQQQQSDQDGPLLVVLNDVVGAQVFGGWLSQQSDPQAGQLAQRLLRQGPASIQKAFLGSLLPFFERFQRTQTFKEYRQDRKRSTKLANKERWTTLKLDFKWT
jgi:hypothetical protein